MSRTSIALSNLRAVVILIVLAFHSSLAYLASLPAAPYRFSEAPYLWQAIPIIDRSRWFGLDLFCAWQDVSLMSLMFLLSGLFVPASLGRKGVWTFLSDRMLRIGLPCVLAVLLLIPIAYYPSYRTSEGGSLEAYWQSWMALPFWPCGPQWFLWQLLILNVLAAALYRFVPASRVALVRLIDALKDHPAQFFLALVAASALVYVPLAVAYMPWEWSHSAFSFQLSRPLHYLVYFFAGYALGGYGLDRGLLAVDGPLARHWARWVAAGLFGWMVWAIPTSGVLDDPGAPLALQIASAFGFAVACASGSLALIAVCLHFASERVRVLDSLSANAYGMYLVHYLFVVWLQFALLDVALPAVGKVLIVFAGTLAMSWTVSAAFRVPFGTRRSPARRAEV